MVVYDAGAKTAVGGLGSLPALGCTEMSKNVSFSERFQKRNKSPDA